MNAFFIAFVLVSAIIIAGTELMVALMSALICFVRHLVWTMTILALMIVKCHGIANSSPG